MLAEMLRNDPAYKIVGECGDGQQAYNLCLETKPDLAIPLYEKFVAQATAAAPADENKA